MCLVKLLLAASIEFEIVHKKTGFSLNFADFFTPCNEAAGGINSHFEVLTCKPQAAPRLMTL